MRTTLDIDDDVLLAVKDAAIREKVPFGRMMSILVRKALALTAAASRNGVLAFEVKADSPLLSLEGVNKLRDED